MCIRDRVSIVYFSGTGTTAEFVAPLSEGIVEMKTDVHILPIISEDIQGGRWQNDSAAATLDDSDGIIFGTPTYMGGVSSQLKSFFDAMAPRWYTQAWNGKLAAAFTVSSLASGDKTNCLQDINTFAMQMGMIWVGTGTSLADQLNPNGYYLGLGAIASAPDQATEVDLKAARHLGGRVASLANRLAG